MTAHAQIDSIVVHVVTEEEVSAATNIIRKIGDIFSLEERRKVRLTDMNSTQFSVLQGFFAAASIIRSPAY